MTSKKEVTLPALIKTAKLTKEDAVRINEQYKEVKEAAQDWVKKAKLFVITEPSQVADIASCKAGYDFLRTKFNEIESLRKELKEESLRKSQVIDAIGRKLKALIEPTMNDLKEKSEFAKTYDEAKIKEKGGKRLEILAKYDVYMSVEDAASMLDDVFDNYVLIAKKNHDARQNSELAILLNEGVQPVVGSQPMIGVSIDHTESLVTLGSGVSVTQNEALQMHHNPGSDRTQLTLLMHRLTNLILPDVDSQEAIEVMRGVEQDLEDAINRIKKYLNGTK